MPYAAAAAGYAALAAALFYQLLFLPLTISAPDSFVPMAASMALDRLYESTGAYPLWQPWSFSGMPTVEAFSYLSALYYPNILLSRLPLGDIGAQLIHLCLAGLGCFMVLRRFSLHPMAAFLGGAAFMMNPYMTAMLVHGHGSQLMTAAYMPWVLWATLRLFDRASLADAGLLALFTGFQLQRAHVQIAWYTWMVMALLALMLLAAGHKTMKDTLKKAALFMAAGMIGIAMSAAVYLPASEYAAYSVRGAAEGGGAALEYASMWSMHPVELLTFLVPGLFGFGGVTYWGFMPFTDFPHYSGIVVLLLAAFALARRKSEPFVLFLAGSALLALFISFGSFFSPVFDLFYNFAPLFSRFRVPSMVLVVVYLDIALLAGFGLHELLELKPGAVSRFMKLLSLSFAAVLVLFVVLHTGIESFFRSLFPPPSVESFDLAFMIGRVRWEGLQESLLMSVLFAAAAGGLTVAAMKKIIPPGTSAIALLLLALLDLFLLNSRIISPPEDSLRPSVLVPRTEVERALAPDDVTRFLAADRGRFRICPLGPLFGENKFALSGIESVGGYHPAKLKNYEEFLRRTDNFVSIAALRMLNVRYLVSPAQIEHPELEPVKQGTLRLVSGDVPVFVYRLKGSCPRFWFASTVTGVGDRDDLFSRVLQESDDCRTVYVDGSTWQGTRRFAEGSILSVQQSAERMALRVSAPTEAFLVASEVFYPLRWKAAIDGKPVPVIEVNGLIRGVRIPSGDHELLFTYDRSDFDKGQNISLAAFGLAVLMLTGGVVAGRSGGKRGATEKAKS
ncbi:MAG: hypothetical protein JZU72_01110 [Chlorobium phaeobacteroides]|jgi:hypothetical protein|nr:hypothetical protein [Chlorobium phaeobacteroides]